MIILSKETGNCLITGRVTKNGGEMKYVGQDNKPMYQFSVCYQNDKLPSGKWDSKYITCKLFGEFAMNAPTVNGSQRILCAGKWKTNEYTGRDGKERKSLEMTCDYVLLGSTGNQSSSAPQEFQEVDDSEMDGDLPF